MSAPPALRPVAGPEPLPFDPFPPVLVATTGELAHVAAMDATNEWAFHVALDGDGVAVTDLRAYDLDLLGLATVWDSAVLVGLDPGDGTVDVSRVSPRGRPERMASLVLDGAVVTWPRPVGAHDGVRLVWEERGDSGYRVRSARLVDGALDGGAVVELPDLAEGTALAAAPGGVVVARQGFDPAELVLLGLHDDGRVARASVRTGSGGVPAICACAGGWLVAWVADGSLGWQRCGPDLVPAGAAGRLALDAPPPGRVHQVTVAGRTDGPIALGATWERRSSPRRSDDAEPGFVAPPAREAAHRVVLVDPASAAHGEAIDVGPAGHTPLALAWLGDRLVAVHGGATPDVTVLAAG